MKCSYCGNETQGWQLYCPCCGTRQPRPDPQQPISVHIPRAPEPQIPDWEEETVSAQAAEEAFPVIEVPRTCAPALQLSTRRGLGKMFFLGILTLGIYPAVIWSRLVQELNMVAGRYDGDRTVSYFGMQMIAPFTLFVYAFVWMHDLCDRVGRELRRRNIDYAFGPRHFWLWNVLGTLILAGPFVFTHKLMKAMNLLNEDYNRVG